MGVLLLARSHYELTIEGDYSMTIILAAAAFEAQLSFLLRKWSRIDKGLEDKTFKDEKIDEMLRKYGTIAEKIEEVCRSLDSRGIDEFVCSDDELWKGIETGFPSLHIGSLPRDFQVTVFWPRNRILHNGFAKFGRDDANRIYSIADIGLRILRKMDGARRENLNVRLSHGRATASRKGTT